MSVERDDEQERDAFALLAGPAPKPIVEPAQTFIVADGRWVDGTWEIAADGLAGVPGLRARQRLHERRVRLWRFAVALPLPRRPRHRAFRARTTRRAQARAGPDDPPAASEPRPERGAAA